MGDLGRLFVWLGVALAAAGLCLLLLDRLPVREFLSALLARLPLGRLPGDIRIEGEHSSFFFPIVTCLVVSVALSLLFALFRR